YPKPVVADYSYFKNAVFASMLLKGRELRLYEQLDRLVLLKLSIPTLIVYLDARNDVLLDRIRRRNRTYESTIDAQYLDDLRQAYERGIANAKGSRVVRYETSDINLTSEMELDGLYKGILNAL